MGERVTLCQLSYPIACAPSSLTPRPTLTSLLSSSSQPRRAVAVGMSGTMYLSRSAQCRQEQPGTISGSHYRHDVTRALFKDVRDGVSFEEGVWLAFSNGVMNFDNPTTWLLDDIDMEVCYRTRPKADG